MSEPKALTRNELLVRVASSISLCANMIPTNPANLGEIVSNAQESSRELPRLAGVLRGLLPHADGGGVVEATKLWVEFLVDFPAHSRHWPKDVPLSDVSETGEQ